MARQYSIFMQHIIRVLLPYFRLCTRDVDAAAAEIAETLQSYGVRTRAEFIKAAEIIALSMVKLETLAESTAGDLPPPLRLRYRGCANSLTRSSTQCEKSLEHRLAGDSLGRPANEPVIGARQPPMGMGQPATAMRDPAPATPDPANDVQEPCSDRPQPAAHGTEPGNDLPHRANDLPAPALAIEDPINDMSEEDAIAAVEQVRAQIDSHRARLSGQPPAVDPLPDLDDPAWVATFMEALRMGAAQATAGPGG